MDAPKSAMPNTALPAMARRCASRFIPAHQDRRTADLTAAGERRAGGHNPTRQHAKKDRRAVCCYSCAFSASATHARRPAIPLSRTAPPGRLSTLTTRTR
uniref:Uncharacterized protein n=1 Tax=Ralstonia solanacearum TaxID=305 RepID=A0A809ECS5_RALSL